MKMFKMCKDCEHMANDMEWMEQIAGHFAYGEATPEQVAKIMTDNPKRRCYGWVPTLNAHSTNYESDWNYTYVKPNQRACGLFKSKYEKLEKADGK